MPQRRRHPAELPLIVPTQTSAIRAAVASPSHLRQRSIWRSRSISPVKPLPATNDECANALDIAHPPLTPEPKLLTEAGSQPCPTVRSPYALTPIGRGQFGCVYRALDRRTGQYYFAELVGFRFYARFKVARLLQEMELTARLRHPNLLTYMRPVRTGSKVLILTEQHDHVPISTLHDVTNPQKLSNLVRQILKGLRFLHRAAVAHGNLRASTVLVTSSGTVKLSHYGLSISLRDPPGSSTAPETILETRKPQSTDDIWALGSLLEDLLGIRSSLPPAGLAGNSLELSQATLENTPAELQDFVQQCLQIDPLARPTADQLLCHPWLTQSLDPLADPQPPCEELEGVIYGPRHVFPPMLWDPSEEETPADIEVPLTPPEPFITAWEPEPLPEDVPPANDVPELAGLPFPVVVPDARRSTCWNFTSWLSCALKPRALLRGLHSSLGTAVRGVTIQAIDSEMQAWSTFHEGWDNWWKACAGLCLAIIAVNGAFLALPSPDSQTTAQSLNVTLNGEHSGTLTQNSEGVSMARQVCLAAAAASMLLAMAGFAEAVQLCGLKYHRAMPPAHFKAAVVELSFDRFLSQASIPSLWLIAASTCSGVVLLSFLFNLTTWTAVGVIILFFFISAIRYWAFHPSIHSTTLNNEPDLTSLPNTPASLDDIPLTPINRTDDVTPEVDIPGSPLAAEEPFG